jgi:hypothetical protein
MARYKSKSELALESILVNPGATPKEILAATQALERLRRQRKKNRPQHKPEPRKAALEATCLDCGKHYDDCTCLIVLD